MCVSVHHAKFKDVVVVVDDVDADDVLSFEVVAGVLGVLKWTEAQSHPSARKTYTHTDACVVRKVVAFVENDKLGAQTILAGFFSFVPAENMRLNKRL